jgi:hypothetical protein
MATPGYSGTPLIKKLGIKPGIKLLLLGAPEQYFDWLEMVIPLFKKNERPDLVHLFAKSYKSFENEMKKLEPVYNENPQLTIWVSWYKKSAKITTDITEDDIRNYALKNGLVDVKVCAVSEEWSGLKLVVPLKKR